MYLRSRGAGKGISMLELLRCSSCRLTSYRLTSLIFLRMLLISNGLQTQKITKNTIAEKLLMASYCVVGSGFLVVPSKNVICVAELADADAVIGDQFLNGRG